jgi:hypothetical protein
MQHHPLLVVVLPQVLVLELVQLMVELPQVPPLLVLVVDLAYAIHL